MIRACLLSLMLATGCRYDADDLTRDAECPCAAGFACTDARCQPPDVEPLPTRCRDEFLFCDGFETGTRFMFTTIVPAGTGRVETTANRVRWGRAALVTEIVPTSTGVGAVSVNFAPAVPAVYAQAWFRFEEIGPSDRLAVFALTDGSGAAVNFGVQAERPFANLGPTQVDGTRDVVPSGAWLCIVLSLERVGSSTTFVAQIDGDEVLREVVDATIADPARISGVSVGPQYFNPMAENVPATIYVDDVIVDDVPLPCPVR